MTSLAMASPAKLNLYLAVTGRRADGFHDLLSLAAPVAWGDTLGVRLAGGGFSLECDDPAVPLGEDNLVLRAARAFNACAGLELGAAFVLEKRIPMNAGLGGGSSNAVAALLALNELSGSPLDFARLEALAARLGSDCAMFLRKGPSVMRGRGESVEAPGGTAAGRISGRRAVLFKPAFGIGTAWAYGRLAGIADRSGYSPPDRAEARLGAWIASPAAPAEEILHNDFERVVLPKFPAAGLLLARLRGDFGLEPHLSGSGSTCFALLPNDHPDPADGIAAAVREAWGPSSIFVETRLA
jgi:4-diphosphocytidyl-2-C-methyl-D-erythritol kinase